MSLPFSYTENEDGSDRVYSMTEEELNGMLFVNMPTTWSLEKSRKAVEDIIVELGFNTLDQMTVCCALDELYGRARENKIAEKHSNEESVTVDTLGVWSEVFPKLSDPKLPREWACKMESIRTMKFTDAEIEGALNDILGSKNGDKTDGGNADRDEIPSVANGRVSKRSLATFPPVIREENNRNILIKGRWLERGGSAFLVSTAGTGKSIWTIQFALSMVYALPFSGLEAWRPLKTWIIQSEDSDDRVSIDRDDVIAGLTQQHESSGEKYDWNNASESVKFVEFTGLTGSTFLEALDDELSNTPQPEMPDVIIINPFLDFLGGDMCSQEVTSAFLAGGVLGRKETRGLRYIIRKHHVGCIIVHHTGKPPTEKELKSWIMSAMPEYQAAGSSYVTNWGRSFITMMKMKVEGIKAGSVMLTAGKNGSGLGWPNISGAYRKFLMWSNEPSCGGTGFRHFWREPNPEEYELLVKSIGGTVAVESDENDVEIIAEALRLNAASETEVKQGGDWRGTNIPRDRRRAAIDKLDFNPTPYGLEKVRVGQKVYIGVGKNLQDVAHGRIKFVDHKTSIQPTYEMDEMV